MYFQDEKIPVDEFKAIVNCYVYERAVHYVLFFVIGFLVGAWIAH